MTKLFAILQVLTQTLPLLVQLIRSLEEAIPGQGAGEQKLAALRGILESAYSGMSGLQVTFEEIWPVLQRTTSSLVAAFNKTAWKG